MVRRLSSPALVRLLVALLIATIGLQASEPVRDVQRTRGSAFSAATVDVAIATTRRAETVRMLVVPEPPLPAETTLSALPASLHLPAVSPRPESTGPPEHPILPRQHAPRAPPLA